MTRLIALALLVLLATTPAAAQETRPLVKYGKWVLLAGSVGLNYLAARDHDRADDAFEALEAHCAVDESRCDLGPGGEYTDPTSETLYQASVHYDDRARRWLIAGQTALIGAAALFIWEFTSPKDRPENIPFEPEVRMAGYRTLVGVRVRW